MWLTQLLNKGAQIYQISFQTGVVIKYFSSYIPKQMRTNLSGFTFNCYNPLQLLPTKLIKNLEERGGGGGSRIVSLQGKIIFWTNMQYNWQLIPTKLFLNTGGMIGKKNRTPDPLLNNNNNKSIIGTNI